MSHERAKAFMQRVNEDAALRSRVESLNGNLNGLLNLAAESGYAFTVDNWNDAVTGLSSGELGESDLDSVAGGVLIALTPLPNIKLFQSFSLAGPGAGPHVDGI